MEWVVTLTMDTCHQGDDLHLFTMDQSDKVGCLLSMENCRMAMLFKEWATHFVFEIFDMIGL